MPEDPVPATRTDTPAKPQTARGSVNVRPVGPVVGFCFVIAGSVTAYVGYQLGQFYGGGQDPPPGRAGAIWGLLAGLVVASLWCGVLYRATRRLGRRLKMLALLGTCLGTLLTACSASLLTLREMAAFGWERIAAPGMHLASSLGAGAGLGAVWGLVCGATWTRAVRLQQTGGDPTRRAAPARSPSGPRYLGPTRLTFGLCLLAGLVLGMLASIFYDDSTASPVVGCVAGALGSVAVADLWVRAMRALSPAMRGHAVLMVFLGTSLGVAAGMLATAILHGALMLVDTAPPGKNYLWLALGYYGIPVGAIIGVICSLAWVRDTKLYSIPRGDRRAGGADE